MNEKQLAAETITHEVNRLRGLLAAGEQLKMIGDLEQTERELRSSIQIHEGRLAQVKAAHELALQTMEAERKEAQALREELTSQSQRFLFLKADAIAQAKKAGEDEAAKILDAAAARVKGVNAQIEERETHLNDVKKEVAVKEWKLKSLKEEMAELTRKHLG